MRALLILLLCAGKAVCFDFASIDATNANWVACGASVADITVKVRSRVPKLFERVDAFAFRYAGPRYTTDAKGLKTPHLLGHSTRTFPAFEANGNKGWLYVREMAADGAHLRCVVREAPDGGAVLYEREFVIPWGQRKFSLQMDGEQFEAEIIANGGK